MLRKIWRLYYEGFKNMKQGKTLWLIIIIKLIFMFVVLKMFFFPNFLNNKFSTDKEKSEYIIKQLTLPAEEKINKN